MVQCEDKTPLAPGPRARRAREVGPLDFITILLENDYQHGRRVGPRTKNWLKMGPITVSRAPEGSVGRGILGFYGWGGPEPVGAQKRAGKRNIKKLKSLFFFQNLHFAFVGPFCGSNGLGTPQTTIKVEDSAHNGPLRSSGDCNRTHVRPIFGSGGRPTPRLCWWSFFNRIVIQSSGPTSFVRSMLKGSIFKERCVEGDPPA